MHINQGKFIFGFVALDNSHQATAEAQYISGLSALVHSTGPYLVRVCIRSQVSLREELHRGQLVGHVELVLLEAPKTSSTHSRSDNQGAVCIGLAQHV